MTENKTKRIKTIMEAGGSREGGCPPCIWATIASYLELDERFKIFARVSKALQTANASPLAWLPTVTIRSCMFPVKLLDARVNEVIFDINRDVIDELHPAYSSKSMELFYAVLQSYTHVTRFKLVGEHPRGHIVAIRRGFYPHIHALDMAGRHIYNMNLYRHVPNLVSLRAGIIPAESLADLKMLTTVSGDVEMPVFDDEQVVLPPTITDLTVLSTQVLSHMTHSLKRLRVENVYTGLIDDFEWLVKTPCLKTLTTLELPGRRVPLKHIPPSVDTLLVRSLQYDSSDVCPNVTSLTIVESSQDLAKCFPNLKGGLKGGLPPPS